MIQRGHWMILPCLILLGALAWGTVSSSDDSGEPRPAPKILDEHDAVEYPGSCDEGEEEAYFQEIEESARIQCRLAYELFESYPWHSQLVRVMKSRWALMRNCFQEYRKVYEETRNIVAHHENESLANAARFSLALAAMELEEFDLDAKTRLVEEAIAGDRKNVDGAIYLLMELAGSHIAEPAEQKKICRRVLKEYHRSTTAVNFYKLLKKMGDEVTFEFNDPFTGRSISLEDYRGRKVLVFFYDTLTMDPRGDRYLFDDLHRWRSSPDGENLAVVGLMGSLSDLDRKKVRAQAEILHIDWPVHSMETLDEWARWSWMRNVYGMPTLLLLDEQGRLAGFSQRVNPLRTLAGKACQEEQIELDM